MRNSRFFHSSCRIRLSAMHNASIDLEKTKKSFFISINMVAICEITLTVMSYAVVGNDEPIVIYMIFYLKLEIGNRTGQKGVGIKIKKFQKMSGFQMKTKCLPFIFKKNRGTAKGSNFKI